MQLDNKGLIVVMHTCACVPAERDGGRSSCRWIVRRNLTSIERRLDFSSVFGSSCVLLVDSVCQDAVQTRLERLHDGQGIL